MVKFKAWPPVRCPQKGLQGTGKIDKHIAHQEKPKDKRKEKTVSSYNIFLIVNYCLHSYIDKIGATESREAMMIPISQILAVSNSAQVGSPFSLPCPKI